MYLNEDLEQIEEIDSEIISFKREQEILNDAIDEIAKKISVPYLSQIDSINSIIYNYYKKKEIVDECIRIHRKIDKKNNTNLI